MVASILFSIQKQHSRGTAHRHFDALLLQREREVRWDTIERGRQAAPVRCMIIHELQLLYIGTIKRHETESSDGDDSYN